MFLFSKLLNVDFKVKLILRRTNQNKLKSKCAKLLKQFIYLLILLIYKIRLGFCLSLGWLELKVNFSMKQRMLD